MRVSSCVFKPRQRTPDMGKLLYGKGKKLVHKTSESKPTATTTLLHVPVEGLAAALRRAISVQELSSEDILSLLRSHRALQRLDRSEILVETLESMAKESGKSLLTSHHYSLLMAHANDKRNAKKALEFWAMAAKEGKINSKLHGALLNTYRHSGKWEKAMTHCHTMWEDKVALDAHGLHAAMNACRRSGPWESGLQLFASSIEHGTRPNQVVYLEVLRLLEHAKMKNRWQYSLAVLQALKGAIDVTAGHYNAALATLGGHNWEKGVQLFHQMKEQSVLPSRETLPTLLLLQPNNLSHAVRCIAEAHALGLPVTDVMYRTVFNNLFRRHLDHEALLFMEREYAKDVEDTGNPVRATLALGVALLDSLLAHPRPQDALLLYETTQNKIGDVVAPATRGLGSMGTLSQRWMVQGRVAVIDHNVVLSPRLESLISHYDSIFIPFTSIRLLVRRARENGDTAQGRYTRMALLRLAERLKKEEWRMIRVVPLSHQLYAHSFLVEGPTSREALTEMRKEAEKLAPVGIGQRLLADMDSAVASNAAAPSEEEGQQASATEAGDRQLLLIRGGAQDDERLARRGKGKTSQAVVPRPKKPFLKFNDRITSIERVLSVAVMLKSLNPEADIHLLSTNTAQLDLVEHWKQHDSHGRHGEGRTIVPVWYPRELHEKAPVPSIADVQSEAETAEAVERQRMERHAVKERATRKDKMVLPS